MGQNYFAIASWFWTTVLSYSIFCVISKGRIWFKLWQARVLCWTLPLIITLLPLSTSNYGSGTPDAQWCLVVSRGNNPVDILIFWSYASFFFWLFLSIFLMTLWGWIIHFQHGGSVLSPLIKQTYRKVWLYPVAMTVCWLLNYFLVNVDPEQASTLLVGLSMLFGISYGIFTALIYILNNPEVVKRWEELLRTGKPPPPPSVGRFTMDPLTSSFDGWRMPSLSSSFINSLSSEHGGSSAAEVAVGGDADFEEEELFTGRLHSLSEYTARDIQLGLAVVSKSSESSSTLSSLHAPPAAPSHSHSQSQSTPSLFRLSVASNRMTSGES